MVVLNGKEVALAKRKALAEKVKAFQGEFQVTPGLTVVLVGEDPASQVYVRSKVKTCREVGIDSHELRLPEDISAEELKAEIQKLSQDSKVHGILVQLPLPVHLNKDEVIDLIPPEKDVDGLTPENIGLLFAGRPRVKPCTPYGVIEILKHYNIEIEKKVACVVGRSQIVGLPMAQLLQMQNATVLLAHSKTQNLRALTQQADIVVAAAGRPAMLGRDDFKEGAVVVDVGIHRKPLDNGKSKLHGDVRFEELDGWCSACTPVPGGVGPMTIAMLLENTLRLAELSLSS